MLVSNSVPDGTMLVQDRSTILSVYGDVVYFETAFSSARAWSIWSYVNGQLELPVGGRENCS